jgi:AcrR family transcriptional regulator
MDKQDTKNAVFTAAAELFASKGFHDVSVREICDEAGVSKPVLYYYFKDKEDLLYKLVNEMHSRQAELVHENIRDDESFEENIKGIYKLYLEFYNKYPHLIRLSTLVHFSPLPSRIKNMSRKKSHEMMKYMYSIFEKGKKEGYLDKNVDTETVVLSFIGPVGILLTRSVLIEGNIPPLKDSLKKYFDFWTGHFLNKHPDRSNL